MKTRILTFTISIALLLVLLPGGGHSIAAQGPETPNPNKPLTSLPPLPHGGPYQTQDGLWVMPPDPRPLLEIASVVPQATGGPDDFGYTWNDSVPFGWIDATAGTDSGLGGTTRVVGPIPLPFPLKFYENTYNQIYISKFGYAGFTDTNLTQSQGRIPEPGTPNNIIAPYWAPSLVNESGYTGKVYYTSGGVTPNRYFVIEWHQIRGSYKPDENVHTFEVILYENGDILVQHAAMTYGSGWTCGHVGIEDSEGLDGLGYGSFCQQYTSNKAIRFYRPNPSARVNVRPVHQGRFTHAGEIVAFQIPIRNTGELGTDTYDISVTSAWATTLYAADGTTPLTDTDGDGVVDTGPVTQGGSVTIVARVTAPAIVNVGNSNTASATVCSSLDTGKSKIISLQAAIPAPFAQVYRDNYDGAMSLYLAQPGGQQVKTAANNWWGYYPAVAEAPNGNFAYVWSRGRCVGSNCNIYINEVEYALLNKYGDTVRAVSKLTNNSGATISTSDTSPVVAVAPNGRIGILWYRYASQYINNTYQYNYNIFFAILDASGNIAYGPVNLTNNSSWGASNTPDVPQLYEPRISATGDNRFVLAWQRYHRVNNCTSNDCYIYDIYYAVRDTGGNVVKGITQFTNDTTGSSWEGYSYPNLTGLTGNRALMTWYRSSDWDIYYAVLDSAGNVVKDKTNLSGDGSSSYDRSPDAVQLSDGKIVVGWTGSSNIRFAVLDTNYNRTAGPTSLTIPAATTGSDYVSVAADNAGRAILTWMDANYGNRRNLYYALVNGSGGIVTQPMIFRTSQASTPRIETSYLGYGNTSYSSSIATGVDTAIWPSGSLAGGAPGGAAVIGVNYANHGQTTATGVVLTATLGTELTYLSDTSGVSSTIAGNLIIWNLPDLSFLDKYQFTLYVGVPSTATIGTRYPVALAVAANETETNISDNTTNLEVMAALQVYLPLVSR